ncbi:hypothetical protein, partial [Aminobacterium sp. UBA1031]|uniref:hypothetical protein n=1 Tax=Aminobacterium sp. UBA1031 TaxID=1946021 RepID=UPI00257F4568
MKEVSISPTNSRKSFRSGVISLREDLDHSPALTFSSTYLSIASDREKALNAVGEGILLCICTYVLMY